jgi:predicted dithiol-disulfide oxidoreductase (DUF899 family)
VFPGESEEYRRERNKLLDAEIELRLAIERVAAQRRALPPGGAVPEDYRFEAADGGEVRLSELFAPAKGTLVIYSYNRDYRAESPDGDQIPILNVFVRDGDAIRHAWATELMFAPRDEGIEARHVDSIWPIWNVLDMTPQGRDGDPTFPKIDY